MQISHPIILQIISWQRYCQFWRLIKLIANIIKFDHGLGDLSEEVASDIRFELNHLEILAPFTQLLGKCNGALIFGIWIHFQILFLTVNSDSQVSPR